MRIHWILFFYLSLFAHRIVGAGLVPAPSFSAGEISCRFGDEVSYLQSHASLHPQSPRSVETAPVVSAGDPIVAHLQAARPIALVHIPKCGSSFANALMHLPGLCPNLPPGFVFYNKAKKCALDAKNCVPVEQKCPGSFSSEGRYSFIDHSGIGGMYQSVVKGHGIIMLRQPEHRLLSAYYDLQHSWPWWYYKRPARDALEFAQVVSGCSVRMLTREGKASGWEHKEPNPCGGPQPATAAEVTLAKKRLREGFVFVGLSDEWALTICLLHAVFGGNCQESDIINTRSGSVSSYNISELMGFQDVADGALYEEASSLFAGELQRYGLSYEACQPCFQQASAPESAVGVATKELSSVAKDQAAGSRV